MKALIVKCLRWPSTRASNGKWPKANTKALIQLAEAGYSSSQIAQALSTSKHKVTRSAVCGKASRMGVQLIDCSKPRPAVHVATQIPAGDPRPTMPFVRCLANMQFSTFVMSSRGLGDAV